MKAQELHFTNNVAATIDKIACTLKPNKVFVIADNNTATCVLPLLGDSETIMSACKIITNAGDENKSLESLSHIWKELCDNGATRGSLAINVGGGVITDIGGFASATFKRGITFVNVPTTLLANVDAAIGGKTGINFNGLKNEIGAFCNASHVIISTKYFRTLPKTELLSGYAELLKHAIISSGEDYERALAYNITDFEQDSLLDLLQESVSIKARIVREDPTETGLRKALNFGHTAGHAFEELALSRKAPIPHGYAVAWGMVVATILSHTQCGFPANHVHRLAGYVRNTYGAFCINCKDYDALLRYMSHDKKNRSAEKITFTLLEDIGNIRINAEVPPEEIKAALDIYCDEMGI